MTTELSLDQAVLTEKLSSCVICAGNLEGPVLDLGQHYLTDFLDAPKPDHPKSPLVLYRCPSCESLQLGHAVNRDRLFRNYWYRSGVNATVVNHLKDLAAWAAKLAGLEDGDVVVDIGSNDGTLLAQFDARYQRIGFEPSQLATETPEGIQVIQDYFSAGAYGGTPKAKLVTSLAMFYDLADPMTFVSDIASILAPKGLWVCEMNYAGDMVQNAAFDMMGHEHLAMYFLSSFNKLLRPHGLAAIHVERNSMNGGSFRIVVAHAGAFPVSTTIDAFLYREAPLRAVESVQAFINRTALVRATVSSWVKEAKARGRTVMAYGASTRGMTMLQACNLDSTPIKAAIDKNPAKVGKIMAGVNIPVISETAGRAAKPSYMLILPWGFVEEFKEREAAYLKAGGHFIVPLPRPTVL